MPGLIDSPTGLDYGDSLCFMKGLGSPGLDNPLETELGADLEGHGQLRASAVLIMSVGATFAGTSSV